MSSYRIASRYAKSLIDLAIQQDKLESILGDVEAFAGICRQRDMALLLKSPVIKPDKKGAVLKAIFHGKVDPLTYAFFEILLRKGREAYLPEIAEDFIRQYRDIKGITIVHITSAAPLPEATLEQIRRKLVDSKLTHHEVRFETSVDPELIGGFVIAFEDKLYDASVRHQLDNLRKQFTGHEFQIAL